MVPKATVRVALAAAAETSTQRRMGREPRVLILLPTKVAPFLSEHGPGATGKKAGEAIRAADRTGSSHKEPGKGNGEKGRKRPTTRRPRATRRNLRAIPHAELQR